MSDWSDPLASGCSALLGATLKAMQAAEAAGANRDAGRYAEQAATLIAKLRLLRMARDNSLLDEPVQIRTAV